MHRLFPLLLGLWTALQLALPGLPYAFRPTLKIDAAAPVAPVTSRASGFLYGLAQAGVPDPLTVESLDPASVTQKVLGGLQHPIGDVDEVAQNLDSCDYITVYLNDVYDTWYYDEGKIRALRKAGNYDSAAYVREDFLPRIAEPVRQLGQTPYADRLVYCLFNEMDNGVWFGTPNADNPDWLMFDDAAKTRFYAAWEETFRFVRTIVPDARIGGPGNCGYDSANIRAFLTYCKAHDCLPDVMIYHELAVDSTYYWQDHYDDYRASEQALGLDPLPIIVTEIGTMEDCGAPAKMLNYLVAAETTGVYTNTAFWRLADNLCDTAADTTVPNSNWWLYRWYADLEGQRLRTDVLDVTHADFENTIKYGFSRFHQRGLTGLAALTDAGDRLDVIAGGCDTDGHLRLVHLNKTALGRRLRVRIECVFYEGLCGAVCKPTTVADYAASAVGGRLHIPLGEMDPTAVYHITITPDTGAPDLRNDALPQRFEFEDGVRTGGCYTYDSAYATTGAQAGMVGGLEQPGDSVTLPFTVPANGDYELKLIYGKANDGRTPDDRIDGKALLTLDGAERCLPLPNTIRSEYTETITLTESLTAGAHTITLAHLEGTFVVDSLLVCPRDPDPAIALLPDADRTAPGTTAYLAVAPDDGFYHLTADRACAFTVDGARGQTAADGTARIALRRGLNLLLLQGDGVACTAAPAALPGNTETVLPADMALTAPATLEDTARGVCLTGISCDGGSAAFTVHAPAAGDYRLTVAYANNAERGVHSYNVDLIEQYLTVTVNGDAQELWCRNTSSWQTVRTATCNVTLAQGENTVTFTNTGRHRFNGQPTEIPHVYGVTLRRACA
ncbi:MAG: carbohydrate-binding protein [Clostridia bacterium]|nr:carbohydrate-binding protein [Clostridia bacterium]